MKKVLRTAHSANIHENVIFFCVQVNPLEKSVVVGMTTLEIMHELMDGWKKLSRRRYCLPTNMFGKCYENIM